MPRAKPCAHLALMAAIPSLAFGSAYFANHTQTCSNCGDDSFYHADFNNDGYEDLAYVNGVAMGGYPSFVVKFSNHGCTFSSGTTYQIPLYNGSTDSIAQLTLGDFTHSGSIDIVAFSVDSGNAYLYHNNGKGVFTQAGSFQYAPPGGTVSSDSAVAADFNHDGNLDLANISTDGHLNIWLGNGKGGFAAGLSQSVNGLSLAMGDFDGDGKAM